MKRIFTIALSFACFIFASAQEVDLDVKSKIEHVTVFLEGAQVTRQATASLKPGVSILTFPGISPDIQERSIQVDVPSNVKILSVSFKVNYLEEVKVPEKVRALEAERRRLWSGLSEEKSMEEVYLEEEAILKTNKSIGGTSKGVAIDELKIAMDYFRQRLVDIKQQQLQIGRNIRKYNEDIGKIDAQLRELSVVKTQPTGEIRVKVLSKSALHASVKLNYLVKEARWFPSYDIRAKNIQSPINVAYKANVSQQSGEDWENVALTISSGNPTQGGARPIIRPWILGFNNNVAATNSSTIGTVQQDKAYGPSNNLVLGRVADAEGEGMPGVNVMIKGTTIGTVTDAIGYYSIPLTADAQTLVFSFVGYRTEEVAIMGRSELEVRMSPDAQQLNEVVVTAYGVQSKKSITGAVSTINEETFSGHIRGVASYAPRVKRAIVATPVVRQTHVEYTLDELFTIKSDGEVRTTDMVEYELDAIYEYYCVPKLDTDAFLIAKVLHWDEHNFLEGGANLFFEGKYIGKSILDTRNTSDTLSLSLGRDGNVLVVREKKKDFTSRHVIGSNQKSVTGYEISIRNKKSQTLTIVVEDQIPVANNKEITVDKIEDSGAEFTDATGLLKWKKTIEPGKTEILNLKYAVRFPKHSTMILE
jgi:hypothetical protein